VIQRSLFMLLIGNCSCGGSNAANCIAPLTLSNGNVSVDGMFVGCLPLSSLLHSTLACFYNETCLDQVKTALMLRNIAPSLNLAVLSANMSSIYKSNTSLATILHSLLVETTDYLINYTAYFNQCQVNSCTYSFTQRNSLIDIITRVLGLCESYFR
jgi:hypothetical protein